LEVTERKLVEALRRLKLTLVFAESCTGGGAADRVTRVAGSSDVFWGSLVTYQERAKSRLLGISAASLRKHGAVSRATAAAMAERAFRLAGGRAARAIAVSTTGVAGPGGGTPRTPVGLCYIGVVSTRSAGRARVVRLAPSRKLSRTAQKRRFVRRALEEALREAVRQPLARKGRA
jgi:PncC family amidohydrolase